MVQERQSEGVNFVGDTLAALGVGIWSWHGSPCSVHCCPVAARLFGIPTVAARNGLPLDRLAAGVHPEDRTRFTDLIGQAQRTGGPFVAKYRTLDEAGTTHAVLDRGEFELGPDGCVVAARGLVVDLTHRPGMPEIGYSVPNFAELPPLDQAVEHGLALYKLMGIIPEGKRQAAEMLLGAVLEILGREVAASLERVGCRPGQVTAH